MAGEAVDPKEAVQKIPPPPVYPRAATRFAEVFLQAVGEEARNGGRRQANSRRTRQCRASPCPNRRAEVGEGDDYSNGRCPEVLACLISSGNGRGGGSASWGD